MMKVIQRKAILLLRKNEMSKRCPVLVRERISPEVWWITVTSLCAPAV
jgi:hypothetical protein